MPERIEKAVLYWNSHGRTMPFSEFFEIEVEERGNYSEEDVESWKGKYGFDGTEHCVWVCETRRHVLPYCEEFRWNGAPSGEFFDSVKEEDYPRMYAFKPESGILIRESDDGDHGYLFVIKGDPKDARAKSV